MKLYNYWRSSASYRVRIALSLKGLTPEIVPVNLLKNEQKDPDYVKLNPQGLLPLLIDDEGNHLTQSLAIIEYLEEKFPQTPLLPQAPTARAHVRALAMAVACEIAPICNSGPLNYLTQTFGLDDEQKNQWYHHWMQRGLSAIEQMLADNSYTGSFCHGGAPTLADCFLIPQIYNARRYACDLTAYPTIMRIVEHAEKHPAFIAAHPSRQCDSV